MIPSVFDKIQVSLFSTSVLKIFEEGLVIISKVFVLCEMRQNILNTQSL